MERDDEKFDEEDSGGGDCICGRPLTDDGLCTGCMEVEDACDCAAG